MGKKDPIASKNRTYLFIKNTLKQRSLRSFSFASHFNKSKQPGLKRLIKIILKKFGPLYIWLNLTPTTPPKKTVKKRLVFKRKKVVVNSLLQGWSIIDLINLLKIPQLLSYIDLKIKVPKIPLPKKFKVKKIKISPSARSIIVGLILIIVVSSSYGIYLFVFKDLPHPSQLTQSEQIVTTRIMSRNGDVLFRIYEDENRTLVKLGDIPQHLIDATIAIEDKGFYYHHGFSVKGIIRAAIANSQDKDIQQGGSTITQQLVKNRLLSSERTLQRKLRELVIAILVEVQFSKDEILEMYFNQVPYGGSAYGVEEAAQRYFQI